MIGLTNLSVLPKIATVFFQKFKMLTIYFFPYHKSVHLSSPLNISAAVEIVPACYHTRTISILEIVETQQNTPDSWSTWVFLDYGLCLQPLH